MTASGLGGHEIARNLDKLRAELKQSAEAIDRLSHETNNFPTRSEHNVAEPTLSYSHKHLPLFVQKQPESFVLEENEDLKIRSHVSQSKMFL